MRGSRSITHLSVGLLFLLVGVGGSGAAFAANRSTTLTEASWQQTIGRLSVPGRGCFQASYPSLAWKATRCEVAPSRPIIPQKVVGDGNDYSAVVAGTLTQATGSFEDVSNAITEKGKVGNSGSEKANTFSLQLNSQFFKGSPTCAGAAVPSKCLAWGQFVYEGDAGTNGVFIQYWLINYKNPCPKGGWMKYGADCYANSALGAWPLSHLTAKQLASVQLTGSAVTGGNDTVSMTVGSKAVAASNTDTKIYLAKSWDTTEWGVFGDGGGGEAFFGKSTTLEAMTSLVGTKKAAPSCDSEGFTGETNNLTLTNTPAIGTESHPTMVSEQTNGTKKTASCATAAG